MLENTSTGAFKIAQWVEVLANKLKDLSLIPETYAVEKYQLQVILWLSHLSHGVMGEETHPLMVSDLFYLLALVVV